MCPCGGEVGKSAAIGLLCMEAGILQHASRQGPKETCDMHVVAVQDWQVLSPNLLKNLQEAGVQVDAVQIVAGERSLSILHDVTSNTSFRIRQHLCAIRSHTEARSGGQHECSSSIRLASSQALR